MDKHHPFCNYYMTPFPENCHQCKRLYREYPPKKDMIKEYFPEAKLTITLIDKEEPLA